MTPAPDAPQAHGPAGRAGSATGRYARRLAGTLVLTSAFLLVEVAAGLWTGSLALLADAGSAHRMAAISMEVERKARAAIRDAGS